MPPIAPASLCKSKIPYVVYFLPCPHVNIIVHLQVWGQNFSILFGSPCPLVISLHTHTHTHTHTQPPASGLNCHPPPTPLTWASIILSLLCFYEFQHEQFPYNHFTLLNHSTVIRSNENKNGITWPQLNTSVIVFQSFLSCHIFLPTPIKLSFFNWAMIFLTPHYPNVALLA